MVLDVLSGLDLVRDDVIGNVLADGPLVKVAE